MFWEALRRGDRGLAQAPGHESTQSPLEFPESGVYVAWGLISSSLAASSWGSPVGG
jgi:hypothetical protein